LIVRFLAWVLVFVSCGVSAGLDDDFVFSSKLGLTLESVTTQWSTEENGLTWGGQLNGVPRDTWHDLYYLNGKLGMVVIGYGFEANYFETERASRKWSVQAAETLIERASKKYGEPQINTFDCDDLANYSGCAGSIIWRGSSKVFVINALEIALPKLKSAELGFSKTIQMTFSYASLENYDLLSVRLPYLIRGHNERLGRKQRVYWNRLLSPHLRKNKMTLDEFLLDWMHAQGKINELIRKDSTVFVGGVKPGYEAERWARSFRLQLAC